MSSADIVDPIDQSIDDDLDLSAYVIEVDDADGLSVEEPVKAMVEKVLESSNKGPLLAIKVVKQRIGAGILAVLDEKFKGKLTEVRHPDSLDRLF